MQSSAANLQRKTEILLVLVERGACTKSQLQSSAANLQRKAERLLVLLERGACTKSQLQSSAPNLQREAERLLVLVERIVCIELGCLRLEFQTRSMTRTNLGFRFGF